MTRADDIRALAEREAAVAELEDELVAAKDAGGDVEDLKLRLRAARQEFREMRAAAVPEVADGDAVASPDTITASAEVLEKS